MDRPEEAARLLDEIGTALAAPPVWLTFRPLLEQRYRTVTDGARNAHYLRVGAFGLAVYNLFLFTDWQMMPDVIVLALVLHLALATPLCLASLFFLRCRPGLGQPVTFAALVLLISCTMATYGCSRTAGALLMPFSFTSIVITGNIMMPLRFSLALPFSVLAGIMMIPVILLHPGYPPGQQFFIFLNVLGTCAFTLFAAYQTELSDRHAFLLSLRETLRAEALSNDNRQLRALAGTDVLTGVGNRRMFDTMLDQLWQHGLARGAPLGLLLLDLDHFKALNDAWGHQAGDRCLVRIGTILKDHARDSQDCAARYGGEEFVVLLPDTPLDGVQQVAERLREAVQACSVSLDGQARPGQLHVSVGCASLLPQPGCGPQSLVAAADAALYCAKRAGRNRIHPPLAVAGWTGVRLAELSSRHARNETDLTRLS